ncbi:MAG: hypothetical protein U5J82_14265 [Desulfobacterales bacterium]|nr:hypothetical protein [Desulfobacterales bacterium]
MDKPLLEEAQRKKAIFDSMSSRRQNYILRKGYEKWDPFQEPKDPIEIRRDPTRRTSQMLIREFLQSRKMEELSNAYGRGVLELAMGIINNEERFVGMFEFSCWYRDLLEREGAEKPGREGR